MARQAAADLRLTLAKRLLNEKDDGQIVQD